MNRVSLSAALTALVLAGCGSSHHVLGRPSAPADLARANQLSKALPEGFQLASPGSRPPGPSYLPVSPASGMHAAQLRLAPAPAESELRRVLAVVVAEPAPVIARRIFVSGDAVHPGQRLAVAAAHLGATPQHAALFILDGPGYRAVHLVTVANEVAAGYITLPARMSPGTWYIAAEDTSKIRRASSGTLAGTALVDLGTLHLVGS